MSLTQKWSEHPPLQIVISRVSGSPSAFEEYCTQECNAVQSDGNLATFRRNVLPRFSGSKHRHVEYIRAMRILK